MYSHRLLVLSFLYSSQLASGYIANATVWENPNCSGSQTTIEIDVSDSHCFDVPGAAFSHYSESPLFASEYNVGCDVFTFSNNGCFYGGLGGKASCAHFGPDVVDCQQNIPLPNSGQCVPIPFASIQLDCSRYTGDA
ncbi:hypothetical protein BGW36DRAFT_362856 [Talaromyces proteolyticus]|uniref:Uncharacterized protein n=1 Tax=Talaromyces proteolyticus TaxID=1131652 RepID=A0AAD4KGR5_9EURO|nr:uncharacterized protein BGW36DRAFT_362856 [Talaromyces proteolyticus]KAH8691819.1 hypothetical protein BGW36DRAFT_362856 [Talaromyces proteolyticus]